MKSIYQEVLLAAAEEILLLVEPDNLAILAANPDKGKDMLTELSFSEASLLHERLIKDGPDVLARLVSRVSDE